MAVFLFIEGRRRFGDIPAIRGGGEGGLHLIDTGLSSVNKVKEELNFEKCYD